MPDPLDRTPETPDPGTDAPAPGAEPTGDGERTRDPGSVERDRDERLRALTEQALHLLDELGAARAALRTALEEADRERTARRDLEALVAELRRQVRHGRTSRLLAPPPPETPAAVATCLWIAGDTPSEQRDRWLADAAAWLADTEATLVCPAAQQPPAALLAALPRLSVVEADGVHPAQLWNVALATTSAPAVLLLAPGARPRALDGLHRLAALDDPAVAVLQPALAFDDGDPSLGLAADADLRVARRPLAHADGDPVEVDAPAPEAFVLRRAACQRLGPFDEDLLGSVALHEYALRARAVGFRCVGFPSAVVDVPATCRLVEADATRERDRLTMLARHRPQELYPALAAFADFWTMAEADRRAWLRGLLARLPDAARIGPGFDVLIAQADELARRAVPAEPLDRALGALEQTLARDGGEPAAGHAHDGTPLGEISARIARLGEAVAALRARQAELQEMLADGAAALEEATARAERAEHERAEAVRLVGEQQERLAAAAAAADGLRRDLAAVQARLAEREEWIARLLEEKLRRRVTLRPRLTEHERAFLAQQQARQAPRR